MDLRRATASQEIPLGPFVDSTDGNTPETGLTIVNTDIKLWKSGATTLANKNSGGATHIANGVYYAVFDATDSDTIGPMKIFIHPTGSLPIWIECRVLHESIYDQLYGSTALSMLDAAAVRSAVGLASANLDTQLDALPTNAELASSQAAADDATLAAIAALDVKIDTIDNFLDTEIAAILADTNELQLDWADGGRLDLILDARASQASVDTVDTVVAAILVDTAEIGVAGAGLTNINLPDQTMNITGNITGNVSGSVGSVSGNVDGNVTGSVGSVASAGISSASLAASAQNAIADAILDRNMASGVDSGTNTTAVRTPRQALRALRNKVTVTAGVATVTKEDDASTSWTASVTTTAGNPVSGVDPT